MLENIQIIHIFAGLIGMLLIWAAINDARFFIIPNWVSASLVGLFLMFIIVNAVINGTTPLEDTHWISAVVTALVVTTIFTILFAMGYMGGGDVKLIGAISLWAGAELIVGFLLATTIAGGILAIFWTLHSKLKKRGFGDLIRRPQILSEPDENLTLGLKTSIPYGIAIAAGGLFVMAALVFRAGT